MYKFHTKVFIFDLGWKAHKKTPKKHVVFWCVFSGIFVLWFLGLLIFEGRKQNFDFSDDDWSALCDVLRDCATRFCIVPSRASRGAVSVGPHATRRTTRTNRRRKIASDLGICCFLGVNLWFMWGFPTWFSIY